jgi:hypothetical protein
MWSDRKRQKNIGQVASGKWPRKKARGPNAGCDLCQESRMKMENADRALGYRLSDTCLREEISLV